MYRQPVTGDLGKMSKQKPEIMIVTTAYHVVQGVIIGKATGNKMRRLRCKSKMVFYVKCIYP